MYQEAFRSELIRSEALAVGGIFHEQP